MLSRSIDQARERHNYRLFAFVYMPEHLLIWPEPTSSRIDQLLKAIQRPYSFRIKQSLPTTASLLLNRLTIQQRPNVTTFRYADPAATDSGWPRLSAVPREWLIGT